LILFDNSADFPRLVVDEEAGKMTIADDSLFQIIERNAAR